MTVHILQTCYLSNVLRRGVRSDAQLSSTETRFQKCSQSGKNGSKHPMLSTSMADNVISYKKIKRNTQKNKNAVEWFSFLFQMHFHVAFKVCLSRKTLSTISLIFSPIFQENCVFFIFEASVLSYWQISHWMLFGSLCFLMWLLYWLAPFPFSPHNLHWKGLSLCILYWCSPNYSWLGNLFEHMLQTQSILMLEIILHNWL